MIGSDFFPSRYLKAEEIAELCPMTVTIKEVVAEILKSRDKGNAEENKPVVYFEEIEKGIILNKTNWYTIAGMHGDDSDMWPGKQIALVVVDVDAFGDVVSAIRVKKPAAKVAKKTIEYHPVVKAGRVQEDKQLPTPPAPKPAPASAPDDGWTVESAGAVLTPKGARLGSLTPEQLEIIIEKGKGKMQSAAVYLRAYMQIRESMPTLPTETAEAVTSATAQTVRDEVDNGTPF
jgi:hypothetical protein